MLRKRDCHTAGVDELDESYSFSQKMAHYSEIWIVCPYICLLHDCNSSHKLDSHFKQSTGKSAEVPKKLVILPLGCKKY